MSQHRKVPDLFKNWVIVICANGKGSWQFLLYFWEIRKGKLKGWPVLVLRKDRVRRPTANNGIRGFSRVFPKFARLLQKVISFGIYKCSTWNVLICKRKSQMRFISPTPVGRMFPTLIPRTSLYAGFLYYNVILWELVVNYVNSISLQIK